MPIYKLAHNKYQVQVRIKGQSRYGTYDKKSVAQEMEMKFKQEIKQGRNIELTKKLTLADLCIQYRDNESKHKVDHKTEVRQINRLLAKYKWLLNVKLDNLNSSMFNKFKNIRVEDIGIITIKNKGNYRATNKDLVLLGTILDTARNEWDIGVHNFAKDIKKYKQGKSAGRRRPISKEEYKKLLYADWHNEEDKKIWRALLVFLRHNPIRPIDLHKLTWNEMYLEDRQIVIKKPKNNKTRQIDLLGPTRYLYEIKQLAKKDNKVIPKSQRAIILARTRLQNRLGIEDLELYDFKRHAVTKLIKQNKDIAYVTRQAGWNNFNMAYTYFQEIGVYG